jgi:hypothetical protein
MSELKSSDPLNKKTFLQNQTPDAGLKPRRYKEKEWRNDRCWWD